jgi:plasmid replication initiation protein
MFDENKEIEITEISEIEISEIKDILIIDEPLKQKSKMVNIPSSAIHIENDISLLEKKLWFELIYHAFPNMGKEKKVHEIPLSKLRESLGYSEDTSNDQQLKEALKKLSKSTINWNIFNKDKLNAWESISLLAGCHIPKNSGICYYDFSAFLEQRFLSMGEEAYVKIDLIISNKFQSKHSLSIYCLALDYLILKMGYSEKKFSLEEIRKYLAIKEGEYKKIGHFNDRVILPAEKEINEISDLKIEILPLKDGRKIAGYKLCMGLKPGRLQEYFQRGEQLKDAREKREEEKFNLEKNILKKEISNIETEKKGIRRDLIKIKDQRLKDFFAKYNIAANTDTFQDKQREINLLFEDDKAEKYLLFLANYAENEYKKGRISNLSGFFVSMLKSSNLIDNYLNEIKKEAIRKEENKRKVDSILETRIKENYETEMSTDFDNYLINNIYNLEEKFIEIVKKHVTKGFAYDYLIMNQNKGVIDKSLLLNYKSHVRLVIINEIKPYQEELFYKKPTFEDWKEKKITNEYLTELRNQIEKEL